MKYDYTAMYLDYFNNYLTVEVFAEHYELHPKRARRMLNFGRALHQDKFGHH